MVTLISTQPHILTKKRDLLQCCPGALPVLSHRHAIDTVSYSEIGLNGHVTHVVLPCSVAVRSTGVRET